MLVQNRRNTGAALRLLRKLLTRNGIHPESLATDKRAENSHLVTRRRERKQRRFQSHRSAQRFLATHTAVQNNSNVQRHLIRRLTLRLFRAEADRPWAGATVAA